jgi:glyoxylase-like metal-dependent hydrolase (beta-lactamase superfamily II)
VAVKPTRLTLRCYGVGFGDCFLLTFHYPAPTGDRHVLIDFGSTQSPPNGKKKLMKLIADDIATVVGKPLHVLVATHRHADHISGFATNASKTGTGDVIAGLQPQLVIQPWTERPDAPREFIGKGPNMMGADDALRLSLTRMSDVAVAAAHEAGHLSAEVRSEIKFVADDGVANLSAVKNLAAMGKKTKAAYVQYGSKVAALKTLLPGVAVTVLGPPTIKQKSDVLDQDPVNKKEYWHFAQFWALRADAAGVQGKAPALFPRARTYRSLREIPIEDRWFVRRLRAVRGKQLLGLVRAMDDALNNTSVILLFEAGKKKLLFPGDAQWENWELALTKNADLLKDVDVYKVGHHGSLNATPKTLWNAFSKKSEDEDKAGRLVTVMSTRSDSKHGHVENDSEVPRRKLVTALKQNSAHRSTQELEASGDLVLKLEFDL